jgi:hypothetical protein
MSLVDWEKNVDTHYKKRFLCPPLPCTVKDDGFCVRWVVYGDEYLAAKEMTVLPGRTAAGKEAAAFGWILVLRFGMFGEYEAEAACVLSFGQLSGDEYFVSEKAAAEGLRVTNRSKWEPLVFLQHFGPNSS